MLIPNPVPESNDLHTRDCNAFFVQTHPFLFATFLLLPGSSYEDILDGDDDDRLLNTIKKMVGNSLRFLPCGGRVRMSPSVRTSDKMVNMPPNGKLKRLVVRDLPHLKLFAAIFNGPDPAPESFSKKKLIINVQKKKANYQKIKINLVSFAGNIASRHPCHSSHS